MRSSKYHDYRVAKIALFIILVILGLFIYIKCIRAPLQHTAGEDAWTILKEVTCTEDGLKCKICTECGEEFDHEVVPATGHVEGVWVVDKKATCTEDGSRYKSCKNCDDYEFARETIAATGHTPGTVKVENVQNPTCTEGGSYDNVVYCKTCNTVLSKETVPVDPEGHTYGPEHDVEIVIDSTHTKPGTYIAVITCTKCNEDTKIKVVDGIEPKGHTYSWELKYDENTGKIYTVGTCTCDEEGNVVVINEGDGLTIESSAIPGCCRTEYKITVTVNGEIVTETIKLDEPLVSHSIKIEAIDATTGELISLYYHVSKYAKYDEQYGEYYDLDVEGMIFLNLEGNEWDENGFALGAFKCALCEDAQCSECNGDYWYIVRIYSSEYDKRLTQESEN